MNTVVLTGYFEFGTQKAFNSAFSLLDTVAVQLYKGEVLVKDHHFVPESNQFIFNKAKHERVSDNMYSKTVSLLEKIAAYAICGEFNISLFDSQNSNKTFRIVPSSNDKTAVSYFLNAVALRKSGKYDEAQLLLSQLIEKHPKHASAYMLRGKTLLQLRQPEQALIDFETSLRINPHHPQALIGRVNAHRDAGTILLESAAADLRKVISVTLPTQPTFWKARRILGELLYQHGLYAEALAEFKLFLNRRFEPCDRNFHLRSRILALAGVCATHLGARADATKYFDLSIESDADEDTLKLIAEYRPQNAEMVC